jgi:hypothetical protein
LELSFERGSSEVNEKGKALGSGIFVWWGDNLNRSFAIYCRKFDISVGRTALKWNFDIHMVKATFLC